MVILCSLHAEHDKIAQFAQGIRNEILRNSNYNEESLL